MKRLVAIPTLVVALLALVLSGCATTDQQQISPREYSQPRETVRAAQEIGAQEIPRARMFLTYAVDGINKANKAIQEGETYEARLALARAQADADLALTLAKERRMVRQVREIDQRIQKLRQDMP